MKKILFGFFLSTFFLMANAQTLQEGIQQMENENYAAALNTFNSICRADPKDALPYYYIGEVYYKMEQFDEADKAYSKGLSINAQCAECYVGLGKLELDEGNTSEAEKEFESAIRADKKNAAVKALIGDAYLYGKKPNAKKAIEYLTEAVSMDPSKGSYWAHLGDAYQLIGDNGSAVTNYENAVEKDPTNVEAIIKMARIWARAKQETLAIQNLEKAMQLAPNDARPIKDLYELYIRERRFNEVLPLLEKYIQLIGSDIDAKVRLVKFLTFQAKDYDRAIEMGEKLLQSNPDQYTLHRWLAWANASRAKEIEGDKPTKTLDSAARIYYVKAEYHSKKLFDAISKDSKRQAYPEDYDFWALSTLKIGDVDQAAHIYRKYIEFAPDRAADIYGTLAKTYFDSANYQQALAYYDRKAAITDLTSTDIYYKAYSHYYLNQNMEADTAFARFLEAVPNFAQAWYMRAQIGLRIDTTNTLFLPKPFYEKYIEFAVSDPVKNKNRLIDAYHYLAVYYVKNDQLELAKEYLGKVLELEPEEELAIEYLKKLKEQR